MIPMPLPPDWVLEGDPAPTGVVMVRSPDNLQRAGFWHCQSGRFRYLFGYHETIQVLEGQVTVTDPDGVSRVYTPGDWGHFPKGLDTVWEVQGPFKKLFLAVHES